jgi:hypothetical protein
VTFSDLASIGAGADAGAVSTDLGAAGLGALPGAAPSAGEPEAGDVFGGLLDVLVASQLMPQAVPPPALAAGPDARPLAASCPAFAEISPADLGMPQALVAARMQPSALGLAEVFTEAAAGDASATPGITPSFDEIVHDILAPIAAPEHRGSQPPINLDADQAPVAPQTPPPTPAIDVVPLPETTTDVGDAPPAMSQPATRPAPVRSNADAAEPVSQAASVDAASQAAPVPAPQVTAVTPPASRADAAHQTHIASPAAADAPASPGSEPAPPPTAASPSMDAQADSGERGFDGDESSRHEGAQTHGPVSQSPRGVHGDVTVTFPEMAMPASPIQHAPAAAPIEHLADEPIDLADLTPQIVRSARLQLAGDIGQARIHLRPEHLGDVIVDLRVEQGDVIASLRADAPEVREWIQSRAEELRAALGAHGLDLVHVSVNEREQRQGKGQESEVKDKPKGRKAKGTETRVFEIAA